MTCIKLPNGFVCYSPYYRLRLSDGTCVFMSWHSWCGPEFYHDKACTRFVDNWWDNELIEEQLSWFVGRGEVC